MNRRLRHIRGLIPSLAAGALFLSACGGDTSQSSAPAEPASTPPATLTAAYSSIQKNIFQPKCMNCHSSGTKSAGIDLTSYASLIQSAQTHGDPVVVPGDPKSSHLYMALDSHEMPPAPDQLSDVEIKTVGTWITQGAKEN